MRLGSALCFICGLMFLNIASAQTTKPTAPPVQPTTPAQVNPYPAPLYRMNNVSKSLNLTQTQIDNLNKMTAKMEGTYRDRYNKLESLKDNDRWSREMELNRQYYGDWGKGAQDILSGDQWTRYQQLYHQYSGFNSLYDPNVQKEMNLTPAQLKGLEEQRTWNVQQLQTIDRQAATDRTKAAQLYSDYWKARQDRMNSFLTPEQQRIWGQMTGEPFTFQPSFSER